MTFSPSSHPAFFQIFLQASPISPSSSGLRYVEDKSDSVNITDSCSNEQMYTLHSKGIFTVVGDVAAEEVSQVAGALTSVPGGAGPMTIAALLSNTYLGASRQGRTSSNVMTREPIP